MVIELKFVTLLCGVAETMIGGQTKGHKPVSDDGKHELSLPAYSLNIVVLEPKQCVVNKQWVGNQSNMKDFDNDTWRTQLVTRTSVE